MLYNKRDNKRNKPYKKEKKTFHWLHLYVCINVRRGIASITISILTYLDLIQAKS